MKTISLEVIILDLDTSDHGSSRSLAVFFLRFFCLLLFSFLLVCFVFRRSALSSSINFYLLLARRLASIYVSIIVYNYRKLTYFSRKTEPFWHVHVVSAEPLSFISRYLFVHL